VEIIQVFVIFAKFLLQSQTRKKEKKKPTTLGEFPFNLYLSINSHYQLPVHRQ
jgi:hypothetical protein